MEFNLPPAEKKSVKVRDEQQKQQKKRQTDRQTTSTLVCVQLLTVLASIDVVVATNCGFRRQHDQKQFCSCICSAVISFSLCVCVCVINEI